MPLEYNARFLGFPSVYKKHGAEIAVVTLQSLPTKNSEEYRAFAIRLFNSWGIGNAARDTGVLILLIKDNRRFEVVTGTGLATVVPAAWLSDFQENELEGPLKGGDYSRVQRLATLLLLTFIVGTYDDCCGDRGKDRRPRATVAEEPT